MILQLAINDKYTTTDKKYNVVAEWFGLSKIKQNLSINIGELAEYINSGIEYNGYYWFEIR